MKKPLRFAIVLVLTAAVGFLSLSDVVLPWYPFWTLGFDVGLNGVVLDVTPGSDAERQGIRPGDRVDLRASDLATRTALAVGYSAAPPHARSDVAIVSQNGVHRMLAIETFEHERSALDNAADLLQSATYVVFLAVGAGLVLLRPSRLTWAFFVYALAADSAGITLQAQGPLWLRLTSIGISGLDWLSWLPFVLFALRFPSDRVDGWRAIAERALLASSVVLCPLTIYASLGIVFDGPGIGPIETLITEILPPVGLIGGALIFFATYARAEAADKTRIRLVIVGFVTGYAGLLFANFLTLVGIAAVPIWVNDLAQVANVLVPITVAYAIVRYRVFDIRIVVRRAAIYAVLTTLVVALVAALDELVSSVFARSSFAALGGFGAAIVIGLTLNPLHRRIERSVDALIFRRRRLGEARLARIADGLLHARTAGAISECITSEPVAAFDLASAAHFERSEDGIFVRRAAIGWIDGDAETIDGDARIVLQLEARHEALVLAPADVVGVAGMPEGTRAPALALPIVFRGSLDGFALFGAHVSGEEIDDDEQRALAALLRSAAAAFDHLDADATRARLAELESALAASRQVRSA